MFQLYFGRSLLWKRGSDTPLGKIDFPPNQNFQVPSWSWMAYSGTIDFVDAPFNGVDWNDQLSSPWTSANLWASSTGDSKSNNKLQGVARDFDWWAGNPGIVYDAIVPPAGCAVKCVVVGTENRNRVVDETKRRHFVLVVKPRPDARTNTEYVRVGVGILPASSITSRCERWVKIF